MEVTGAIDQYVRERALALKKFADLESDEVSFHAEVGPTSTHHKNAADHYQAEFTVNLNGQRFFVRALDEDMYASIDKARDDLLRQIHKSRSRHRVMWRKGSSFIKKLLRRER